MARQARQTASNSEEKTYKRWSPEEDARLVRQITSFPHNLHKCFHIVAEEIDRTPTAVEAHWYAVTSKKPEVMCFFTASPHHVSKNRKNGIGVESNGNIWRRLMAVIRSII